MSKFDDKDGVVVPNGIATKVAVNDVNNTTPTKAELTISFGAPTTLPRGFLGFVNDAAGGVNFYVVGTDGTDFFFLKMIKAA